MATATAIKTQHNGHKSATTQDLSVERERDEFDSAAFEEQRESLPYLGSVSNVLSASGKDTGLQCPYGTQTTRLEHYPYLQMLNHQDPTQSGFFITLENAEAGHFTPTEEWTEHLAVFQNGQTVEGYRSLTGRFLILRKSKLLIFDRENGEFIGDYQIITLRSRHDGTQDPLPHLSGRQRQAVAASISFAIHDKR